MAWQSTGLLVVTILATGAACARSPRYYLDRGNRNFAERKFSEAAINYRRAIQNDARFGEAHYRLGLAELELGKGTEAYEALTRAVDLMPERVEAKVKLADLCLAAYMGDPKRPEALYGKLTSLAGQLLAKDTSSYDGLRVSGYLALTDRKPREAAEQFQRANAVKPMEPEVVLVWTQALFQDNRFAEGEKLALDLIGKQKSFGAIYDILYREYLVRQRPVDAESILKTKASNNPKDAGSVLQLAAHYGSSRKLGEMAGALQRLLDNPTDFPQGRLQVGDFYAGRREWAEAIKHYEEGARANPKEKGVYKKKASNVLVAQGKREEAVALVEEILKEQPGDDEARTVRAGLLLDSGTPDRLEEAVREFGALVAKKPDDVTLRFQYGRALAAKGTTEAAQTQFLEAIRRRKDFLPPRLALAEIHHRKRDYKETLRYANEILSIEAANPTGRLLRIIGLMGTGGQDQARADLASLLKDQPRYRDAWMQLGLLDISQGRFKEAEALFRRAYKPGLSDLGPLEGLVETYAAQNQFDKAFQLLDEELKKTANAVAVRATRARTAVRAEKYDLAIAEYRQLLAGQPKAVELHVRLGEAFYRKGDIPSATASFQKAQELEPGNPVVKSFLALTLDAAGKKQEAIANYRRVLEQDPDNAAVMNNLAYLLAETEGNLDDALRLAQRAQQKLPENPDVADTLGWIYLKKNMTDSALQIFTNLALRHPTRSTFHYHLGLSLVQKGDKTRARSALDSALSNRPSSDEESKIRELMRKIG